VRKGDDLYHLHSAESREVPGALTYWNPRSHMRLVAENLYSFFNLVTRCGWVVNATPGSFTFEKKPGTRRIGGCAGPRTRLEGCGKFSPVLSCTLYFIRTRFLVSIVLHSAFGFTYNTQHKYPCCRPDSNPQPQQAIGRRPSS
jgi:hypothetical protein